jgi:hypothetical protein
MQLRGEKRINATEALETRYEGVEIPPIEQEQVDDQET